ncbi:MAG TPA: LCP family protein, partial [Patescibacteria group bacterium]
DTIMIASIEPKENKIAMISVPRDLYVDNPVWGGKTKINAVYAAGEENGKKEGLVQMEKVVGDITGLTINYGVSINFQGFTQLVDAIGGVDITLDKPFEESIQFNEPKACDSNVFTIPTGQYQNKIVKSHTITLPNGTKKKVGVKAPLYPLCTPDPKYLECGGNFKLPAGKQTLSGEIALCYARARYTSSDFERAKRQQQVIQLIKDKLLSAGTLTDFGKLNGIADSLGDNVRSDTQPWEMKRLYDLYTGMQNPQVFQRVLENSEEGLLYNPPETKETGYILLPIGDNYDKIRETANNIFTLPPQTDIQPK